ncbi:DoxX family protein [Mesorhizobium sp. B2-3-5]|uniref:DoxX family protein n=1 Tax=Mesorhizobium sp. B2-3-5 TaxID=2589958 RepID=UPI00112CF914|nr:DoxX family protein [Mesorhizobium sp. B2-3-5]TPM26930.1 DoxX family protein [Mesorhizobium sp. B2-3-5]
MIDLRTAAFGAFVLRVVSGVLFLAHAALKIFVFTPAGTAQFFGSLGLPPELAYLVILIEVVGGAALILGVYARLVSLVLIIELLGAIFSVHAANGFFFNNANGGWEYPAFWALTLAVQILLGYGAFALVPSRFNQSTRRQPAAG